MSFERFASMALMLRENFRDFLVAMAFGDEAKQFAVVLGQDEEVVAAGLNCRACARMSAVVLVPFGSCLSTFFESSAVCGGHGAGA